MARIVFLLALLACTSCLGPSHAPDVTLAVPEGPGLAYQRAVRCLTSMGGLLSMQDPAAGTLQAHLPGGRILTVQITATDSGSLVKSSGYAVNGSLGSVFGTNVAEDFVHRYQTTH